MSKISQLLEKSKYLEKELLSNLFIDLSQITKVRQVLDISDFFVYKTYYEILLDCFTNDKNHEIEFKIHKLKISDFIETPTFRDINKIIGQIKDVSNSIKIYSLFDESMKNIPLEDSGVFITDIQKKILQQIKLDNSENSDIESIIKEFRAKQQEYKDRFENGKGIIGIDTGYSELNAVIDGFRPEHLWVVGGYTNMGKTATSLNFVANMIKQGKRVVYFSLEMGRLDILSRLLGILLDNSGLSVLKGFPHDEQKVQEMFDLIAKSQFTVFNNKTSLDEIIFSMMEQMDNHVDLFVIDFLQLVYVKGSKNEYDTTTQSILQFQQIAKRLKSTVMVLSQISNDGARNADEVVMSFKGSGGIAAAADLAIEININETDKKSWKEKLKVGDPVKMKWNIRKNRHGKIGAIEMLFNGRTGIFKIDDGSSDDF